VSFSYDPTDNGVGTIRLLITDTSNTAPGPIFQDEELAMFLQLEQGSLNYAAAKALERIATSNALIQKQIKILDLETDGATLSAELRAIAKQLREDEENLAAFDIAEMVEDPFSARERIYKQWLRLRQ
jgi:hypothetical protein